MKTAVGTLVIAAVSGLQAGIIAILGFSPHVVSTASVLHQRAAPDSQPVTVLFVGDIMLDRNVRKHMEKSGDAYPFRKFETIAASVRHDLLIGNLEGAISRRRPPEKTIDFAFASSTAHLLKSYGFDAVSLANNHSLDQGFPGYDDTARAIREAALVPFGHQVKDDFPAVTVEAAGHRIALLGYNITDNPLDEKAAAAAIRRARDDHDLVLIMLHWGTEYELKHNQTQSSLAHRLIDYGADAVIGAHPHVVQGLEIYNGKPIIYSLGNFIFDQYFSEETQQGIAVAITFGRKTTLTVIPVAIVASQPQRMEGDPARKFLTSLLGRSLVHKDIITDSIGGLIRGLDRGELVLTW